MDKRIKEYSIHKKRFIVIDDYTIVDIEEERLISTDEIVDKMNELHEENIMLKNIKKDKIIKRDYTSMRLYDNKTEKENEQLKSILKEMVRVSEDNGAISPMRVKSMVYNFMEDFE